jgi:DNA-binding transcriptional regulator YhcF (GntR family)
MSQAPAIKLPKRPRIKQKEKPPDLRKFVIMPYRAFTERRITNTELRVLGILCSYCNRAGITWVSQKRMGQDLGVTAQAINRQLSSLKRKGFVELVRKGFRGVIADTLRVVFDENVSAEEAIAMNSGIEDCRPPGQIEEERKKMERFDEDGLPIMTPEKIAENKRRLAETFAFIEKQNSFQSHEPRTIGDVMQGKTKTRKVKQDKQQPVDRSPRLTIDVGTSKFLERIKNYRISEIDMRYLSLLIETGCTEARFIDALETMPGGLELSDLCEALISSPV